MKYCDQCQYPEKCQMYRGCQLPPAKEKPLCPSDATPCYSGVYKLLNDAGEWWISKPDNGGDLGDMQDTVAEFNRLLDLLQRTHYNLISRHGWGDADAALIGNAMGWDSGSQNVKADSTANQ
jgi:hypothetical protein